MTPRLPTLDDPLRILVFPGGSEVGLEIAAALRYSKIVRLHSASADIPNHAPYIFSRHHLVPSVHQAGWLEALNALIEREKIDLIFPAHDEVGYALAENAARISAGVIGSSPETVCLTRFKSLTYERLRGLVPLPDLYTDVESIPSFPVFIKPDRGQGSIGARRVESAEELRAERAQSAGMLTLEYLPGREYTVDCFSDRDQGLRFCSPRERTRVKAGIAMSTTLVNRVDLEQWAPVILSRIPLSGAWFYQMREDAAGRPKLLEVGARIAGAMSLNRILGVNLPLLSVYEHCRIPVTLEQLPIEARLDRALVNRFASNLNYEALYVDLDDTLLLRGRVNTQLVRLLYQAVGEGKWISLITRSRNDPVQTLQDYRIRQLFDEVIWLQNGEPKSASMTRRPAVLIDDSYRERKEAAEAGQIAIDCSQIDLLLDDRI